MDVITTDSGNAYQWHPSNHYLEVSPVDEHNEPTGDWEEVTDFTSQEVKDVLVGFEELVDAF